MKKTPHKFQLENLQKKSVALKKCSIADVCKGKLLPNNRTHFYEHSSGCISCIKKKTKQKWIEKKSEVSFF